MAKQPTNSKSLATIDSRSVVSVRKQNDRQTRASRSRRRTPFFFGGMLLMGVLCLSMLVAFVYLFPQQFVRGLDRLAQWQGYRLIPGEISPLPDSDDGSFLWSDAFVRGEGDDYRFESLQYGFRVDIPSALASFIPDPYDDRLVFGPQERGVFMSLQNDISIPEEAIFEDVRVGNTIFGALNTSFSPDIDISGIQDPIAYRYTLNEASLLFYADRAQQGLLLSLLRTFELSPNEQGVLGSGAPLFLELDGAGRINIQAFTDAGVLERRRVLEFDQRVLDAAHDIVNGRIWIMAETGVYTYDAAGASAEERITYASSASGRILLSQNADYIVIERRENGLPVVQVLDRDGAQLDTSAIEHVLAWATDRSLLVVADGRLAVVTIEADMTLRTQFIENVLSSANVSEAVGAVAHDGDRALVMAPSTQGVGLWTLQWVDLLGYRVDRTGTTRLDGVDQKIADQYKDIATPSSLAWAEDDALLFSDRGNTWLLSPDMIELSADTHRSSVGVMERVLSDGRVISLRPVFAPDGSRVADQIVIWDPRSLERTVLPAEYQWIAL